MDVTKVPINKQMDELVYIYNGTLLLQREGTACHLREHRETFGQYVLLL